MVLLQFSKVFDVFLSLVFVWLRWFSQKLLSSWCTNLWSISFRSPPFRGRSRSRSRTPPLRRSPRYDGSRSRSLSRFVSTLLLA